MAKVELFKKVSPTVANIDGPVGYSVYERDELPADDHSSEYIHTILNSKEQLVRRCLFHAGMSVAEMYARKNVKFDHKSPSGEHIMNMFYIVFCNAFVNPDIMKDKGGIPLKQAILDNFTKYNEYVKATHRLPLFVGPPAFMVIAWNSESLSFVFPTVEKLITGRPIVRDDAMIMTIEAMWASVQAEKQDDDSVEQLD
jgi:hypothetical protein